ncbi:MAG: serine/threonine-protein kinase [Lysobacterales bacterium]
MSMLKLDPSLWRRAQGVFDQVVDLPRSEREAALLVACGSDDDLRDMVDGLLAADDRALPEPQPAVVALGRLVDPEILPGSRIGSFEVEKLIGAGGMGRVYLAHRSDGRVEQSVAIKTIRGAYGGRDLLERFGRERRILAKLDHPNVARFIDAGECPDGSPYVAMEFVAGTPILDHARKHKLPLRARLQLFLKVASAVDHAHRQLVVHRDLKPGNVMVDAQGEPKLLDFGIAKPLQQNLEMGHLDGGTAPEARYFSLKHAAPEQIDGDADSVSVDIYALGGLLYELLTGRMPLDLAGLSFNEARSRIQQQMPPAPSSVVSPELPFGRRELAGDLDRIVLHALRKEPERRYVSAGALIDDVQRLLDHRPISLRASHRWYLLARFLRRHRLASAMSVILLGVIVSAAVVFRYQRDEAVRESQRAEMVSGILTEAFRSADPSRNGGEKLSARDVLHQARIAVDRKEELDRSTRTQLLMTLSDVHSSLGLDKQAIELAQQALDAAASSDQKTAAELRLAESEFDGGEASSAKERTERLLRQTDLDERMTVRLKLLLVNIEGQLNQRDVAALAADVYRQALQTLSPDDPLITAVTLNYAGSLLIDSDTAADGADLVRARLGSSDLDEETPERLSLLRLAARAERSLGNPEASVEYARRSLTLAEKLYGTQHAVYVITETGYAISLSRAGQMEDARAVYDQALKRAEAVYGRESAMVALLANNIGSVSLEKPLDVPKAREMTAMAVDIGPRVMPPDSRQMAFFWCTRAAALLLGEAVDADAALAAAENASSIAAANLEMSTELHAEAELLAAVAEMRLGREASARARVALIAGTVVQIDPTAPAIQLARDQFLIGDTP